MDASGEPVVVVCPFTRPGNAKVAMASVAIGRNLFMVSSVIDRNNKMRAARAQR